MIPCTKIIKGERSVHNQNTYGPLFIWNITPKCNLKCAHCYRDSSMSTMDSELSDEKCYFLVREIKKLNPPIVLLTGGEPLLRRNFFGIVKECQNQGLKVGLSTNGTLINKGMASRIKDSGIAYVGISIDGTEDFHDYFRSQKGAFRKSFQALSFLNTENLKTGVRFTLTKENKDYLMPILTHSIETGVKRFCLYHLVYSGRAKSDWDLDKASKRKIMNEFFDKVQSLSVTHPDVEVLTTDNHADGVFLSQRSSDNDAALSCIQAHGGCSAGVKVLYLDSTGEVYPCQFLRDEVLGNVGDRPLQDILNDPHNEMLRMLQQKSKFVKGRCQQCRHNTICGGCRARAKAVTGNLWDEDPGCYLERDEICANQLSKL